MRRSCSGSRVSGRSLCSHRSHTRLASMQVWPVFQTGRPSHRRQTPGSSRRRKRLPGCLHPGRMIQSWPPCCGLLLRLAFRLKDRWREGWTTGSWTISVTAKNDEAAKIVVAENTCTCVHGIRVLGWIAAREEQGSWPLAPVFPPRLRACAGASIPAAVRPVSSPRSQPPMSIPAVGLCPRPLTPAQPAK